MCSTVLIGFYCFNLCKRIYSVFKHAVIQCYTVSSIIFIGHTGSKSIDIRKEFYMFAIAQSDHVLIGVFK